MACLDTTFLVDLLRGKEEILELRKELDISETKLCVAAPSVMELWVGLLLSNNREKEMKKVKELIGALDVLHLDKESAEEAGRIEAELIQKGKAFETEDIMIAAIALQHQEKLVTRDEHYARIQGLKVLKY